MAWQAPEDTVCKEQSMHDIAFVLALGCAIALHCIALHCIVAFEDTVQGWVYDIGLGFAAVL